MRDINRLVEQFREQGFCTIEGLYGPDEVAALRSKTDAIMADAFGVAAETEIFDLEETHRPDDPRVRRIKRPHKINPMYWDCACFAPLVEILQALIGPSIRLHHSKINLKSARYGAPLDWHQDWAFIPHTNPDLAIASVMLDEVDLDNGPLLLLPGSHRRLLDHHDGGWFVGAIDPELLDTASAVPVIGPPGTVTLHHPLLVHGSALNRSARDRRLLFYEYAAADAWPLIYGVEYGEYNRRLVAGDPEPRIRMTATEVKMPHPVRNPGSIYRNQVDLKHRFFETTLPEDRENLLHATAEPVFQARSAS
ncbi:MAG TPA: phytanoyl-CoA dioxygenase family protein [Stellaceae bacterium]|nr:phytanoyl-CoA dioxygenase family protein [Stellaceae bacterium]